MPIRCDACKITLTGPVPYEQHVAGRPHQLAQVQQSIYSIATQIRGLDLGNTQTRRTRPQATRRPRGGAPARGGAPRSAAPLPRSAPAPAPPRPPPQTNQPQDRGRRDRADDDRQTPEYLVDFGVISNENSGAITRDAEVQFTHKQSGGRAGAESLQVSIRAVKTSRASSVQGFQVVKNTYISPGRFRVQIKFSPRNVRRGVHVVRLCMDATGGGQTTTKWHRLQAIVGVPEDHEELKPIAPFRRNKSPDKNDWHRRKMLRGKPPVSTPDFTKLGYYDLPDEVRRQFNIENNRPGKAALEIHLKSLLPTTLNINTYAQYWTTLLWHEELQAELDLKMYDMERVSVQHVSELDYSLVVPGLSEKRPSVIVTDLVAMKEPGSSRNNLPHGGYVTEVQQSSVILRMHESFPSVANQLWDVRFTVNRLLLRRMHDAINKAGPHARILFPQVSDKVSPSTALGSSPRLDRKVAANYEQSLAVRQILGQAAGDVPFVIFGPPGTGKTTALVEAIHQVLVTKPKSRVLVCAPSNSATDIIAMRLCKMHNPNELLRLNAPARVVDSLPPDLRRYSIVEDKKFKSPPKHELVKFRVVVSTCYYASIPRALGIENHFTHIFVDEAGHATEPEVMVAVLQNAGPKTNIIMCGDPMQLGPIVQSKECAKLGLGKSFLDRLMKLPLYSEQDPNERYPKIVKLLENYRSHPAILRFPDVAFYKNQLEYKADPVITQSLVRFSELPQSGFPIIFHSICGHNSQEAKSPSYFNIDEATLVKHYVRALLSDRRHALKAQDIGVISPYRQQCIKIRQLLKKERHEGVDVKVTEDWQGQERRVIIVSTVRSDPELPETSAAEFLGFVSNWRRTNVAFTRAQALLIVIGHAATLELDPAWYFFLHYVHASGGWRGDDSGYPPRLNSNVFLGKPQPIKNYEEFDDARWKALIKAAEAF
ncbi:hypothetical protein RhiJN_11285 [Ceratobasidium sp. AG-Ba]|nr:hypothetical protein RhiJN_11285 [Ceratobasidium sp. AG-Ba]